MKSICSVYTDELKVQMRHKMTSTMDSGQTGNVSWQAFGHWSPKCPWGIKIPTGSTATSLPLNSQTSAPPSAGYDHRFPPLDSVFGKCSCLRLWCFYQACHYSLFHLQKCSRMENEIILLLSAASVSPQRKTNLHGWLNSRGSQNSTFKYLPTEQIAWCNFSFSYPPEGTQATW